MVDAAHERTPLRVLILSPAVSPLRGGIPRFAEAITKSLGTLATTRLIGLSVESKNEAETRALALGGSRLAGLLALTRFIAITLREALTRRWEAIDCVTWRIAAPIALIPRFLRPRLIVHCLGAELLRVGPLTRLLRDLTLRRADELVAISEYTASVVNSLTGRKARVIRPGVLEMPEEPHTFRGRGELTVLSVARLEPRKGQAELVRAVAEARAQGIDLRLTIVGEGADRHELQYLVGTLRAHGWVLLTGELNDDELAELYRSSDIFALLARDGSDGRDFEGFGIVFVEAASFGLPIIAGDSGGAREAIAEGENAIVCRSFEEVVSALVTLGNCPARREQMGVSSRLVARRYLLSDTAMQLLDALAGRSRTSLR